MKSVLIILILSYLGLALLLFLFQRSFLYFPQQAAKNIIAEEIRFFQGEQKLSGWILNKNVLNKEHSTAIIYYGGNAESIEQNIKLFLKLFPNQTTYLIPYRGYGKNTGKPTEQDLYTDALFIYDQLQEKHQKISIIGRSLGTGIATYVAVNRGIEKLVLVTPYDSIENVAKDQYPFFPMSLLVMDKFLSLERAPNITAKTLIIIADNDETISRKRTDNLVIKFKPEIATVVLIKNAGHNDVIDSPEYIQQLDDFIN